MRKEVHHLVLRSEAIQKCQALFDLNSRAPQVIAMDIIELRRGGPDTIKAMRSNSKPNSPCLVHLLPCGQFSQDKTVLNPPLKG